jgi:hypothetical protein
MDEATYERFDTAEGFQSAIERLLAQPGRELRIFDPDGTSLRLNDPARIALFEAFLHASRTRRIYMVMHETEHILRQCPRLLSLLARFSHMMQINRTQEHIRQLQDAFLVLDSQHYVRRSVAAFYRGAAGFGDDVEALAMRQRFMEIWEASFPGVSSTTVGL